MLLIAIKQLFGLYVAICTVPEAPEPSTSPISMSFGSTIYVMASPVLSLFMPLELIANPSFLNIALLD